MRGRAALLGLAGLLLAGTAQGALYLDPQGRGQVLIFPYYTVNVGNDTLLALTNHTDAGKALKLRLREGSNGRVTAQWNLYLGPRDSWTAGILSLSLSLSVSGEVPATIVTQDQSCTVPALRHSTRLPRLANGLPYLELSAADYTGVRDDAGPNGSQRTREGWIEVIEMGTLLPGTPAHAASRNAADCGWFERAWASGGSFATDPAAQLGPPGGDLSGRSFVVNVVNGTAFGLRASAIGGFSRQVQHSAPDAALPDLSSARTEPGNAGFVAAQVWTDHGMVRSTFALEQSIDAVSAVLMRSQIAAEANTETALRGRSEWLLAQPTRPWHTDQARVGSTARAPYSVLFPAAGQAEPSAIDCERFEARFHDREGKERPGEIQIGGLPPNWPTTCQSGQVITINQSAIVSHVLGATRYQPLRTGSTSDASGPLQLDFARYQAPQRRLLSREGHAYEGLPLIGHAIEFFENQNAAPGVRGFYAEATPITGSLRCRMPDGAGGTRDCGDSN